MHHAAILWWLVDVLGAALFALCLAGGLASRVGDKQVPGWAWLAGLVISGLLRALAEARTATAGQIAANRAKQALRTRLFRALLPTGFQRGRLPGEDMRTAIDEVELADGYVGRFLPLKSAAVVSPLLIAGLAASASPVAAGIMLATLLPFALGMALSGTAAREAADRQLLALSRLSGLFVDRTRALPLIQSFAAEDRITRQVGIAAREVAVRTLRVLRIAFVSSALLEFFAALSVALVAVYCGFTLLHLLPFPAPERLDLFRAFFVLALAPEFYLGMRRMAAAYHDKQQGDAAGRAIAQQLEQAKALLAPTAIAAAPRSLALCNLVVGYPDGSRIGPVSAQWPARGLHCLSGPTGCGKSSLLHAILGMAPLDAGALLADGQPVTPGAFNTAIGWAGQRTLLLPGTLNDNLLAGANGDRTRLEGVIRQLALTNLLAARGAALTITPDGSGLSGGERRRIGIGRALLSGRPILLLDEPTADLDASTAASVIACLKSAAKVRLLIVASHDPAVLEVADSLVMLA